MKKPVNKIERLIAKMCPDGVEFRALGEVGKVMSGGTSAKSKVEFWEDGHIPWLKSESCNNKPVYHATNNKGSSLPLTLIIFAGYEQESKADLTPIPHYKKLSTRFKIFYFKNDWPVVFNSLTVR